jgi:PAS domain S-box-containing protein
MSAQPADCGPLVQAWLDQARDHAIVFLDAHGVITGWLPGAETLLGYTAGEALGQHINLIFTSEDRQHGYAHYELTVAATDRFSEDSRWHARKDGTRIWVTGSVTSLRDAQGGILGFVKLMRDQTDERAKTERFENQVEELGEARTQTHLFLKKLGHEMRNPLGVLGNVEQLLTRIVTDDRATKVIATLGSQLQVLNRLSDDLMDVARLEEGKVQLALERADLRDLLVQATENFTGIAERKSVNLESILPAVPLHVNVDRPRIDQVLLNLIGNAIKYTPAGGSIRIRASEEGDEVVCRIQDTGIGIAPSMLPKIFDLFTQASEANEMSGGGIGVGLTLVRQIVELHGGTVQARSPGIGKGSEFIFRLPVATDA